MLSPNKSYLIWLPQGRLGNLIFQYQALISLKSTNSSVFTIRNEFQDVFESDKDITFIWVPSILRSLVTNALVKIVRKFVKLRLFGVLTLEKKIYSSGVEIETLKIIKKNGFLSNIHVFEGFFQSPEYANQPLRFKGINGDLLLDNIADKGSGPLVAVHFRFGDYEKWSIFGKEGVVLPENYYKKSVQYILEKIKAPIFVIFSDDLEKVPKHLFLGHRHIIFKGRHFSDDFRVMSSCEHAIISCSTFAWWAAHLIKNQSKIVIGPKFWIGFKSNIWHPPDIMHPNYIYLDAINRSGG